MHIDVDTEENCARPQDKLGSFIETRMILSVLRLESHCIQLPDRVVCSSSATSTHVARMKTLTCRTAGRVEPEAERTKAAAGDWTWQFRRSLWYCWKTRVTAAKGNI